MSSDRSVVVYKSAHIDRDAEALFSMHLREATRDPDVRILRALLNKYPQMRINAEVCFGPLCFGEEFIFYICLAERHEHTALLLPQATNDFKIGLLEPAMHRHNETARLIIESGIAFDSESSLLRRLCCYPDLLALYLSTNVDSETLHAIGCHVMESSNCKSDSLALSIQRGFDVRDISCTDERQIPAILWSYCSDRHCFDQSRLFFTRSIEPKLALLVLAGLYSDRDLACGGLSDACAQWQQIAPHGHCVLQDCILSYLTRRANGLVRRFGADVCIALQSLDLPALIVCEILQAHCARWPLIPFHCYWNLAVAVKHFCTQK